MNTTGRGPSDDDDDEAAAEADRVLRGALSRRNRGWQGEDLELRHALAHSGDGTAAAVDLNQFRNTVVGQGYQARHVVRQRGLPATVAAAPMDAPGRGDGVATERNQAPRKRRASHLEETDPQVSRLQKYLRCEGLRNFRKEIAKIESSV